MWSSGRTFQRNLWSLQQKEFGPSSRCASAAPKLLLFDASSTSPGGLIPGLGALSPLLGSKLLQKAAA